MNKCYLFNKIKTTRWVFPVKEINRLCNMTHIPHSCVIDSVKYLQIRNLSIIWWLQCEFRCKRYFSDYYHVSAMFSEMCTVCEKYPNTEFFLVHIFLYSVRIRVKTDKKKIRIWTLFTQWWVYLLMRFLKILLMRFQFATGL